MRVIADAAGMMMQRIYIWVPVEVGRRKARPGLRRRPIGRSRDRRVRVDRDRRFRSSRDLPLQRHRHRRFRVRAADPFDFAGHVAVTVINHRRDIGIRDRLARFSLGIVRRRGRLNNRITIRRPVQLRRCSSLIK